MSVCSESLRPWCKKAAWLCVSQSRGMEPAEHWALTGHVSVRDSALRQWGWEPQRERLLSSDLHMCICSTHRFEVPLCLAEHSIFAVPGLLKADMFTWIHIPPISDSSTFMPDVHHYHWLAANLNILHSMFSATSCFVTISETYLIWIKIEQHP